MMCFCCWHPRTRCAKGSRSCVQRLALLAVIPLASWHAAAVLQDGGRSGSLSRPRISDENPSCWTDGYTYERCCSSAAAGAGCFGNIPEIDLYSWDRCCRSPCGQTLHARIENEGLSTCSRLAQSNTTTIIGLWNLGRHKWAGHVRYQEGEGRSYARYLGWLDGLLKKRQALLLFVDAEAAAFARERRQSYGLLRLTCLMEVPMSDLPQMRWRDEYHIAHEENKRQLPGDSQPEVIYADYTLVVNSKPELLACAALWNPFRSTSFAWVDAGSARKRGFPPGPQPLSYPACDNWSLCVGRRMWTFFDFRSKLKRLEHGSTFDSTVLLGGREGVLLYALWFQWAISRYLAERVMDDEQSVIAEVWWAGVLDIRSFYGMTWKDTLRQMIDAENFEAEGPPDDGSAVDLARKMGRWFGSHPRILEVNNGHLWVPFADSLQVVQQVPVNEMTDDHLERIAVGMWCLHKQFGYYDSFCQAYAKKHQQSEVLAIELEGLPTIERGNRLVMPGQEE